MRAISRSAVVSFALLASTFSFPARAEWTGIGEMRAPSRQGHSLRFDNAPDVAVVTALSPEVVRVRVTRGGGGA